MKKFIPLSLLIFSTSLVSAQEVSFRMLMHSGEVRVQKGMEVKTLSTGMLLYPGEEISLGENGYVALVHIAGSTLELTKPGNYAIKALEQQAEDIVAYPNAMQYAEYAAGNISPETKKNRLVASAYEMRGEVGVNRKIRIYIPSAVKVLNHRVLLRWEAVENVMYEVVIRNMHDKILFRQRVRKNEVILDMNTPELKAANVLLVHVEAEGNSHVSSETYALKKLSDVNRLELQEELEMLSPGNNAAEYLILAGFYESKNLLADAMMCYNEAVNHAPQVYGYRQAYEEFLLRNHLVQF